MEESKTILWKELPGIKKVFVLVLWISLIGAMICTTYTNVVPLQTKLPMQLALIMAFVITVVFTLAQFTTSLPKSIWLFVGLIMFISSTLAINTFSQKEIINTEDRLLHDEKYKNLKGRWVQLERQYNTESQTVNKHTDLGWSTGAAAAREQRDQLKLDKDQAFNEMQNYANSLSYKGSIQQEAYVVTWGSLLPFLPTRVISVSSNLIFSLINDTAICVMIFLLRNILGDGILIPIKKKEKQATYIDRFFGLIRSVPDRFSSGARRSVPVGVTVTESVTQNSVQGCDVTPLTPPVIPVTGNSLGNTFGYNAGNTFGHKKGNTSGNSSGNKKGDTIGFKIQGDNPNKLQQEIIEVYDEHKKRGVVDQLNISKLARHAGRSRKYVYTTLQTFTDFKARDKEN